MFGRTKHIMGFATLLASVLIFAACEKENNGSTTHERDIAYTVTEGPQASSRHDGNAQPTTVHLKTEAEFDDLLEQFCDYAEGGSTVTFYNASLVQHSKFKVHNSTKETVTYSTTSREEMKAWMRRMEVEGKTVTVTYDRNTGTWSGTAHDAVHGPTSPYFSVSASRQVSFATGNLQYCAATNEYRMAPSQYTTLCVTTDTIWTDLFIQDTIRHLGHEWRLLTQAEATYLLELRFCSTVAGVENARYARAMVAGVHGIILFPDIFVWPDSVALPVGVNNNGFSNAEGWNDNDYSAADWQQIEAAGAVFLPGTNLCQYGYMYTEYADGMAAYWTSTPDKVMVSGPSKVGLDNSWDQNGHAIRYVHDNE